MTKPKGGLTKPLTDPPEGLFQPQEGLSGPRGVRLETYFSPQVVKTQRPGDVKKHNPNTTELRRSNIEKNCRRGNPQYIEDRDVEDIGKTGTPEHQKETYRGQ